MGRALRLREKIDDVLVARLPFLKGLRFALDQLALAHATGAKEPNRPPLIIEQARISTARTISFWNGDVCDRFVDCRWQVCGKSWSHRATGRRLPESR